MVFLLLLAVPFLALALIRVLGFDGTRITVALLALTPYWVVGGLLVGVLSLLRQWWIAGVVLAVAVALVAMLVPRMVSATQPAASGKQLRIMASNLYFGRADAKTIVQLVRDNQVDVLNLLELTSRAVKEFEQAGLFDLLPYHVLDTNGGGATGSGIASRYPLAELSLVGTTTFAQPSIRVDLGAASVEVVAVHPISPTADAGAWKEELGKLPLPATDGTPRILAGDFNATLDHSAFRRLLDGGYVDAGESRGDGYTATWPSRLFPPPVTIDHVLVDPRTAVADYRVFDIPDSDHKAVFASLTLP
jgi:endonuclease/exonuclease/phosphatase (EEP) superfamily protein YafD